MNAVPTLKDLFDKVVKRVASKWEDLVIMLELDEQGGRVETIRRDFVQHGVEKCCLQALRLWLKGEGKKPISWATLLGVLRDIECSAVAKDIQQYLTESEFK